MRAKTAHGNKVRDVDGNIWLDMRSGIMNVPLGHGSIVLDDALREVISSGMVNTYGNYGQNTHELCDLLHEFDPRFYWHMLNTGAEALDRSVQIASTYFDRSVVVAAVRGGFHGKTMPFSIMRYPQAPWGNPMDLLIIDPDADNVPDFDVLLYEPLMNLHGTVPDEGRLRELCDKRGALMVADEMITGFYRCGPRLLNNLADIVVAGKGLGHGLPIAVIGVRGMLDHIEPPVGWTTTASGNNLCATVALRTLQYYLKNEVGVKAAVKSQEVLLKTIGFRSFGALGFLQVTDLAETTAQLNRHRILATARDGLLRVGPTFFTTTSDYKLIGEALKWQ